MILLFDKKIMGIYIKKRRVQWQLNQMIVKQGVMNNSNTHNEHTKSIPYMEVNGRRYVWFYLSEQIIMKDNK